MFVQHFSRIAFTTTVATICLAVMLPTSASATVGELFRSANLNDAGTARRLLDRGFDANAADDDGNTVLMAAARDGALDVVKLLIARRAKLNLRNRAGDSAIMFGALKGQLEVVKTLHGAGAEIDHEGWTPLHYAAYEGHTAICKFLVDNRADIDARGANGVTPLMMAAMQGKIETAKLLVWEIADPNLRNAQGASALTLALKANHAEIAKLLRVAGGKE